MILSIVEKEINNGKLRKEYRLDDKKVAKKNIGTTVITALNRELHSLEYCIKESEKKLQQIKEFHMEFCSCITAKFRVVTGEVLDAKYLSNKIKTYGDIFIRDMGTVAKYRALVYTSLSDVQLFDIATEHIKTLRSAYSLGEYTALSKDIRFILRINELYNIGVDAKKYNLYTAKDFDMYKQIDINGDEWYCVGYGDDSITVKRNGVSKTIAINSVIPYDKTDYLVAKNGIGILKEV